jgi:hypothetical protein
LLYWATAPALEAQHEASYLLSLFTSTLAALGLSLLLFLERSRSYQLSHLAAPYLLVSVLCDAFYLTMPSDVSDHATLSRPVVVRFWMQLSLFILDYGTPRPVLSNGGRDAAPQERNGLLSRLLFLWINPILLQGYRNGFRQQDMPPLNGEMLPESTRQAMVRSWSERGRQETPQSPIFKC